jgi:hypothetical protein
MFNNLFCRFWQVINLATNSFEIFQNQIILFACHSPNMASSISFWRVLVSVHSPFLVSFWKKWFPTLHDITEILLKLALNTGHNPDPVKYAENCQFHSNYDLILLSESEKGLQSCLDSLNSYCNRWKLKINVTKTKVMVFSKGKRKLFHKS